MVPPGHRLCNALADDAWLVLGPSDPFPPDSDSLTRVSDAPTGTFRYRKAPTGSLRRQLKPAMTVPTQRSADKSHIEVQPSKTETAVLRQPERYESPYESVEPPKEGRIYDDETWDLVNSGKDEQALTDVENRLRDDPTNLRLLYAKSLLLLSMSKFADAVSSLRQVLFLESDFVAAHFTSGIAYLHQGMAREATRAFRQALSIAEALEPDEVLEMAEGETAGRMARAAAAQLAVLGSSSFAKIGIDSSEADQ